MRSLRFLSLSMLISLAFGASGADDARYIELDANTRIKLPAAPPTAPEREGSAAAGGSAQPEDRERAERIEARGRRTAPDDGRTAPAPPRVPPPPAPATPPDSGVPPVMGDVM
jgi:hypothetical protein